MRICKNLVFFLTIFVASAFAQEKASIAVIELDAEGITPSEARIITARLRTELFNTDQFVVLERDKMDAVLKEQGFQLTGCTSNACAVQIGKMVNFQKIVAGNIGKLGNLFTVSIRLIDVETGVVLKTATEDCRCPIEDVLTKSIQKVSLKIAGEKIQPTAYRNLETPAPASPLSNVKFTRVGITKVHGALSKKIKLSDNGHYTHTNMISANKHRSGDGDNSTIIDLDREVIIHLDHKKKKYTEITFAKYRERREKMMQELRKKRDSEVMDLKFDVNVDRTGERQTINGYDCEKLILTMKSRWWEKPKARSEENVAVTLTRWMTPQVAEMEVIRNFSKKFEDKIKISSQSADNMYPEAEGALALYFTAQKKLAEELEKLEVEDMTVLQSEEVGYIEGKLAYESTMTMKEVSTLALDPMLFVPPAGYKRDQ